MKSLLLTYLLWFFGGFLGLHKFYLGRPGIGLLYFFTWGMFFVGWVIDFFTLSHQVRVANLSLQNQTEDLGSTLHRELGRLKQHIHGLLQGDTTVVQPAKRTPRLRPRITDDDLMLGLLRAAHTHGGRLSVTAGVMETGIAFAHVERVLNLMVESNYVYMDNDPATGVIVYVFKEIF